MRRFLICGLAAAACLTLVLVSAASGKPERVQVGNLFFVDDGGIFPSKLPRHGSAPVTARIETEIGTVDGSHPPAIRTVDAEIDRTIQINAVGIPTCSFNQLRARSTADAKAACPNAILGSGEAGVEVAFPEQAPFTAKGPIVLFNGGVKGRVLTVFAHAYVNVPAPTAIVVTATVTDIDNPPYGHHLQASIPRIAGGAGSATGFTINIGRRFTYKGKKQSFLTAGCPSGHWGTKGKVGFEDGTTMAIQHVFACTPEG